MENWGYIFSAYLLAFAGLFAYFIRLKRRIKSTADGEGRKADLLKKRSAVENPQGDRR